MIEEKNPMHFLRGGTTIPHPVDDVANVRASFEGSRTTCRECLIWMGAIL